MIEATVSIEKLIALVRDGGRVRTGVDVYDRSGTLLLARDILVDQVKTLEAIRRQGLRSVPLARNGGVFDLSGNKIPLEDEGIPGSPDLSDQSMPGKSMPGESTHGESVGSASASQDITLRLKEIEEIRREAVRHHEKAGACLKRPWSRSAETRGSLMSGMWPPRRLSCRISSRPTIIPFPTWPAPFFPMTTISTPMP